VAQKNGNQSELQSPFSLSSADFAAVAKKRLEEFASAQTELVEQLQEMNKQWLDRIQARANLASEFASKLRAAKSIPDAMTACQEWGNRRLEMASEDTRHGLDDAQKFIQTVATFANGFASKNFGASP
jgi:hypothetical protein